eukprot:6182121-Pleurochrysis_carterae.AAC.1
MRVAQLAQLARRVGRVGDAELGAAACRRQLRLQRRRLGTQAHKFLARRARRHVRTFDTMPKLAKLRLRCPSHRNSEVQRIREAYL